MSELLSYNIQAGVGRIVLNRPEAMNALNGELKDALRDTLAAAADDPAVRAVLITGAGRAFCVGQDLKQHVSDLAVDVTLPWGTLSKQLNPITMSIATMPKPVVAAINGPAAGAGASLAFACDFRLMADNASYTMAFAGIGLTADSGASWTLPRLVGRAKAIELLMLPGGIGADEALSLALATRVVPADELSAAATEFAERLAAGPTVAYAAIKRSLNYAASHDLAATLAFEDEMQQVAGTSADHLAAVDSFLAKQPPVFTGR
jgi:2-(1,2-epoxy-1,2-dihydrophenyl)acetyl-CoA isomerase